MYGFFLLGVQLSNYDWERWIAFFGMICLCLFLVPLLPPMGFGGRRPCPAVTNTGRTIICTIHHPDHCPPAKPYGFSILNFLRKNSPHYILCVFYIFLFREYKRGVNLQFYHSFLILCIGPTGGSLCLFAPN